MAPAKGSCFLQTVISIWQMFWAISRKARNQLNIVIFHRLWDHATDEREDCIDPNVQPLQCYLPHLIAQPELNNLVRDLNLWKRNCWILSHWRRLRGDWGTVPQKFEVGDGPCIRPPNTLRSGVFGCVRKHGMSKKMSSRNFFMKYT